MKIDEAKLRAKLTKWARNNRKLYEEGAIPSDRGANASGWYLGFAEGCEAALKALEEAQ